MDKNSIEIWKQLWEKWALKGYDSLSEPEHIWFNTRTVIDSFENGGLISYFYNSGADDYDDMLTSLEALGASDAKVEIEKVGALFGESVPRDINERNEIISSWPDDGRMDNFLDEIDGRLIPLVAALELKLDLYIKQHKLV